MDHLQCSICFEPYNTGARLPKFLKCGGGLQHTFCLQCLRRLTVGEQIKCPCCGDKTPVAKRGADGLNTNIYLMPQIEAAAAAQPKIGLEMFCKTCKNVATDKCRQHDLLKLVDLRDLLRSAAKKCAEDAEAVKEKRSFAMELFNESHNILASVAESVRRTVEDYEMDVQLDDDIVRVLERKREEIETQSNEELVESFKVIDARQKEATISLKENAVVWDQCKEMLDSPVVLSVPNGTSLKFPVGEWLRSGDLIRALLAASIVVYSLDHNLSHDGNESNQANGTSSSDAVELNGIADTTAMKPKTTSPKSPEKPQSAAINGALPKATKSPPKPPNEATKTTSAPAAASKAAPASNAEGAAKPAAVAKASSEPAKKPAEPPSFSSMVKSRSAAPEVAVRAPLLPRPPRAAHPLYCLKVHTGEKTEDVVIELRPDMAPIMVKNFTQICDKGLYDNTKFHLAMADDYVQGGKVDNDQGYSPLAQPPEKFVQADLCPLQDECGAIRMKGMGTVIGPAGEKRGLIGSMFMIWVSDTRDYKNYQNTLVFGYIKKGMEIIRAISRMERYQLKHVRLISAKKYSQ